MLGEIPNLNVVESICLHAKFMGNRTALICIVVHLHHASHNLQYDICAELRSLPRHGRDTQR